MLKSGVDELAGFVAVAADVVCGPSTARGRGKQGPRPLAKVVSWLLLETRGDFALT